MIHTLESVIREHPFFQDFPEKHLAFITGCAKNVQFPESISFFWKGIPPTSSISSVEAWFRSNW